MSFDWVDGALLVLVCAALVAILAGVAWLQVNHSRVFAWLMLASAVIGLFLLGGFYVR